MFTINVIYHLVRSVRPLLSTVEHLRRELAWGMPIHKTASRLGHLHENIRRPPGYPHSTMTSPLSSPPLSPRNMYIDTLETPARALGDALLCATKCVEHTIALAYHQKNPVGSYLRRGTNGTRDEFRSSSAVPQQHPYGWSSSQLSALREAEETLVSARDSARETLRKVFNELLADQRQSNVGTKLPQEARDCSLGMIALLQVCQYSGLHLLASLKLCCRWHTKYA